MTHSGSEPESVEVANRSKGYLRDQFEMVSNEPTLPWRGTSAGGGYTTAADLMKFAGALMSNKLLKAETLAEATRAQFTTGAYGFGFQIGRRDEARTYGHGGSAPGMNAILRVYPESGQSVIVLCNLDSPSASFQVSVLLFKQQFFARKPILNSHTLQRNSQARIAF